MNNPSQDSTPFFAGWFTSMKNPKRPVPTSRLRETVHVPGVKELLPWELRPLNKQSLKSLGQGTNILLTDHQEDCERTHSHFYPLIPRPTNPDFGRTGPCIGQWCRAYSTSWRMLPQPCHVLSSSWCCNKVFKRPFHHSIWPILATTDG